METEKRESSSNLEQGDPSNFEKGDSSNLEKGDPSNLEKGDSSNLEKGEHVVVQANPQYACLIYWSSHLLSLLPHRFHFDVHDLDQVQRRLKQRHVQM